MQYDLVIRNGDVVDGSGIARFRADVGIVGDEIATVGRIAEKGQQEIDAEGQVVTPGFIDGHTHMDAQIAWDPLGTCSSFHGVTSVVMGNCGFTLAPARADERHLVVRNLERAEDIAAEAMAAGIDWTWETYPEYLDAIEAMPKGINYAGYVGHSALRTWAMGERAFTDEATDDDLAEMTRQLEASLNAGAIGFTTSRTPNHETSDERPVASRLASWDEVRHLVATMGSMGKGIFEIAHEPAARVSDPEVRAEYLGRLEDLAVETGVPFTFGVLGARRDGQDWRDQLSLLDRAATRGGRMFGQAHGRALSVILSFATQLPFDGLPEWADIRSKPLPEQLAALKDPSTKAWLVEAANNGNYGKAIGTEARKPNFDNLYLFDTPQPPWTSLADLAATRGMDPVELMIDLAVERDLDRFFMQPIANRDQNDALEIMRHQRTVMTFSDSGAHVSQIMDSSIHTHLLGHWVRDRQAMGLEEAVRMITLEPARAWGFSQRGLLREGQIADINVFDPDTIAPAMPTVATDLPAGAKRLKQGAVGIAATVVAGQTLLAHGEHTGALPGRILRA